MGCALAVMASGTTQAMKELEVSIPKGVQHRLSGSYLGQGGPGVNGGPPGDVYLVIRSFPTRDSSGRAMT